MIETISKYKETTIGKIPEDWKVTNLRNIIKLGNGKDYKHLQVGEIPVYGTGGIMTYVNDYLFDGKTVGIGRKGSIDKPVLLNGKFWTVDTLFYIKEFFDVDVDYVFNLFQSINWMKYNEATGLPSLSQNNILNIEIGLPKLDEQKKIAEVLSTWDQAIQETNSIIKKLEKRNKALASKLFLDNDKKSNQKQMIQIVDRIRNSFIPEENKLYKQIGIRSHAKGLFYKEPVTGKSLGNKSVFWIEPNCFIVNIVFAWERAIGKTTNADIGFIASHRFPMYKPKEAVLNLDYLLYFFKSLKGKYLLELASPGGAGRNKTLGQTEFLKLKIPVPSMEKQNKLVDILDTANKELQQYQQKLGNLETQKKGLMQQLLTGKVRTM